MKNHMKNGKFASIVHRILWITASALLLYGLAAYSVAPALWKFYESHHPALTLATTRAFTAQGIPGDPINIAFIGTQSELLQAAKAAGWISADPITLQSSAKIVIDSALHRAYVSAPVSNLFVHGKKQDIALEQPFGPDPSKRHHARFWKLEPMDDLGRHLWLGAATFDSKVGVSHLTGQVTHHIDADVDKERDKIVTDLVNAAQISVQWVEGFHRELRGKNGGGDPFFTDGRLCIASASGNYGVEEGMRVFLSSLSILPNLLH